MPPRPKQRAAHHMAAEEVHECCMLLRQRFVSNLWSCGWSAPTYDAWWQARARRPAYRHYHRCVQLIGSNEPDKRWLLKNPGHIDNLDLLFAIFPDAKVIQTHRDPAKAVPSLVLAADEPPPAHGGRPRRAARRDHAGARGREMGECRAQGATRCASKSSGPGARCRPRRFPSRSDGACSSASTPSSVWTSPTTRAPPSPGASRKSPNFSMASIATAITDYGMTEEEAREPFGDYIQRFDLVEERK